MTKKKELALSNAKIAIVFFVFLAVIVAISLIFKIILVVRAGQFNDFQRFTISVSDSGNTEIMSLFPSAKTIAILKIDKNIKFSDAGKFLEIPIDGFAVSDSLGLNQKPARFFFNAILNYNNIHTNLTIVDILRLFLFARTVPEGEIIVKKISQDLSSIETDKIVGRLVSDELVGKDNQTIRIINGTDVAGLGNRLARLIANMGGNVIIVATSGSPQKKSKISYIDKETYTVKRLTKILKYETIRENNNAISDITITIGDDKINTSPF